MTPYFRFFISSITCPFPVLFLFVFSSMYCCWFIFEFLRVRFFVLKFESCANLYNVFQTIHESKRKPKIEEEKRHVKIIIRIPIGMDSFVFFSFLVVVTFVFTFLDVFLSESFQHYIFTTINGIVETFSRREKVYQTDGDNEGE